MNNSITIEKMTLEDFDYIESTLLSDFDEYWSPTILKQELQCESSHFLVAKLENEIVGFAGFKVLVDVADVMNIVVKKKYRSKGIGSLLLENLLILFSSFSLNSLLLEVNEKNKVAIHLYEHYGFEKLTLRKNYYPNHENAIIMKYCKK